MVKDYLFWLCTNTFLPWVHLFSWTSSEGLNNSIFSLTFWRLFTDKHQVQIKLLGVPWADLETNEMLSGDVCPSACYGVETYWHALSHITGKNPKQIKILVKSKSLKIHPYYGFLDFESGKESYILPFKKKNLSMSLSLGILFGKWSGSWVLIKWEAPCNMQGWDTRTEDNVWSHTFNIQFQRCPENHKTGERWVIDLTATH